MTQKVAQNSKVRLLNVQRSYQSFAKIDGSHPWQEQVPMGHVPYRVRKRHGGRIAYFNWSLAKEMSLIAPDHPERMNQKLELALLDAFAIQIINEYDIMNGTVIPEEDVKPGLYMATRYLQLQHPNKQGVTSGDGRSIWNGCWKDASGRTWDITSCGTGATCLSPATARHQKFFRTGDPAISYGCGYSDLVDGIESAIFSDILHRNGLKTERILCVVEFPGNLSINVRTGLNLLRPSHFFNHLKQSQHARLKASIDCFIDRELSNRTWAPLKKDENRYKRMLEEVARTFAEMAAKFERDYIFCWLAWDGDNILADGGIIDYGSVRQFGLFHHEYRFDDVERWSTNITEQRDKARYIVQTFAQIENFLNTGRKRSLKKFSRHPILKQFDRIFREAKTRLLLQKIGLPSDVVKKMNLYHEDVIGFEEAFSYFERQTKNTTPTRVADGVTRDALFCMRDILRELPRYLQKHKRPMEARDFMNAIKSSYCTQKDARLNLIKRRHIHAFQTHYLRLIELSATLTRTSPSGFLEMVVSRSNVINRPDRVTGDAICSIGEKLIRHRKSLGYEATQKIIKEFVREQVLDPDVRSEESVAIVYKRDEYRRVFKALVRTVKELREGL